MKALVLAAGLGTRLRPLTAKRAKPSLPLVGIPTLWYGAWHLRRSLPLEVGADSFMVNFGHAPESLRQACEDPELSAFAGIRFQYSDESAAILGSSGALWKLRDWIGAETLAVVNGDSVCLPDWNKLLARHRSSGAAITLHVRAFSQGAEPYTHIEMDDAGMITGFGQKRSKGVMFSGAYLIEPSCLGRLPAGASELRPLLLEPLAREGKVAAYREDNEWFDCGTVRSYAEAQFDLPRRLPSLHPLIKVRMREAEPGCWIPKHWNWDRGSFKLRAPLVLTGELEEWKQAGLHSAGPRFVGIEPPPPRATGQRLSIPSLDSLVFSEHVEAL